MNSITDNGPLRVKRHKVNIKDEFATPKGGAKVDKLIDYTADLADKYRESKGVTMSVHDIPRPRKIDKNNWGTAYLINKFPSFEEWQDTAVTAATVDVLYDPDNAVLASGTKIDPDMVMVLKNLPDTLGIRARSKILTQRMTEDVVIDEKWLSLACGNSLPILRAAEASPARPSITLVDISFDNLRFAKKLAKSRGQEKTVKKRLFRDLSDKKGFRKNQFIKQTLAPFVIKQKPFFGYGKLKNNHFDRIEACGLITYLAPEVAARFISHVYELLAPGGRFIFDSCSSEYPQRHFFEGVVQWPMAEFRSVDQDMEIVSMSGIKPMDNTVEMFEPSNNKVIVVYEIRKPC